MHSSETSELSSLVTKMRSPQTHGVEPAIPGIFSFHTMFLLSPHSVGTPVSFEMPSLVGPRHCGQLTARAVVTNAKAQVRHTMRRVTADSSEMRGGLTISS